MVKSCLTIVVLHAIAAAGAAGPIALGCGGRIANESGASDAGAVAILNRSAPGHDAAAPSRNNGAPGGPEEAAPPRGTQLVQLAAASIDGVTSDGYAAYTDLNALTVNVVALEGGAPIALGSVDEYNVAFVVGRAVFFSPVVGGLGAGDLWVWTAASTKGVPLSASAAPSSGLVAVSDDGESILYFDDIDANAIGDLIGEKSDGTGKTRLVVGVQLSNAACPPHVAFAGAFAVAAYCTDARADASAPDAGAAIATVSSFTVPDWTRATIATGVQSQFAIDPNGTALVVGGSTGLLWFPLGGAPDEGKTIDVAGTSGRFVSNGAVVYTTSANALERSAVVAPSPTPLSSGIARTIAVSPDERWVVGFLGLDSQTFATDLYFASTTSSGPAWPLVMAIAGTTGGAYGDIFTEDSSHTIFFTDLAEETGTLHIAPLAASAEAPTTLASNVYAAFATSGSKIVFNDDYDPQTQTAAIEATDTASPTAPTRLVSGAGAPFYMNEAKNQIVYSWSRVAGTSAGLWAMQAP